MSVTHCAISGQPLLEPVVSIKTGHVFERGVVVKFIQSTGRCPITGVDLKLEDLITVQSQGSAKPRPLSHTSVPALIEAFQQEWDASVLETQSLQQHLAGLRKELAHSLYQYDAACRVIARLLQENAALQDQLKVDTRP
jgi:pre-mRNA-processing factor 19